MGKEILIIGSGSAGLLLALALQQKKMSVTVIYKESGQDEDSALICPQLVMDFLEDVIPGFIGTFKNAGAKVLTHSDLLSLHFKGKKTPTAGNPGFLFISRKLFTEELSLAARRAGVKFVNDEVKELVVKDNAVTSVKGGTTEFKADHVFDCTGSYHPRRSWGLDLLSKEIIHDTGEEEEIYQRFYKSNSSPRLVIKSLPGCRGGIYPVESGRFVVNLSLPAGTQSLVGIEAYAANFLNLIGGQDLMDTATPENEWKKITRKSFVSDYYEYPEKRLKNFFPIGEGILSSHPVYGRGISLVVLQMKPLLKVISSESRDEEILDALTEGFRIAEDKWSEVSGNRRIPGGNLVRQWALRIIENDPGAYEQWFRFYQLQCTPLELFLGLFISPVRKMKVRQSHSSSSVD